MIKTIDNRSGPAKEDYRQLTHLCDSRVIDWRIQTQAKLQTDVVKHLAFLEDIILTMLK